MKSKYQVYSLLFNLRLPLIVLLFFFVVSNINAQVNQGVDSINFYYEKASSDSAKANQIHNYAQRLAIQGISYDKTYLLSTLQKIANRKNDLFAVAVYKFSLAVIDNNLLSNPDSAILLIEESKHIFKTKGDLIQVWLCNLTIAQIYINTKKTESAFKLLNECLNDKIIATDFQKQAAVNYCFGKYYKRIGNSDAMMSSYLKALNLAEKSNNLIIVFRSNQEIASYYNEHKLYSQGLETCFASLEYCKQHKMEQLPTAYSLVADFYNSQKKYLNAIAYYDSSLLYSTPQTRIGDFDATYQNLAIIYSSLNMKDSSEKYISKSIELLDKNLITTYLSRRYLNLASFLQGIDADEKSIETIAKAIKMAFEENDRAAIVSAYDAQTEIFYSAGKYDESHKSHIRYVETKDSISQLEQEEQLNELLVKYESEKKDAAIEKFKTNEKIKSLEIEKQKAINTGNLKEAHQKQVEIELLQQTELLNNLKIETQQSELKQQTLEVTAQKQQLKIAEQTQQLNKRELQNQSLIRNGIIAVFILTLLLGLVFFNRLQLKKKLEQQMVLEKERLRISSDLHDELGSGLTAIAMMSQTKDAAKQNTMNEISGTANNLVDNMREMVWSLNTKNDTLENLIGYMHEYVNKAFQYSDIKLKVTLPDSVPDKIISGETRRNIFLAVKECVTNALKYSQAKTVEFNVNYLNNKLTLIIKDDGVGYDTNSIRKNASGIKNISNRMKSSAGNVSINSSLGNGCETTMQVAI